MLLGEPTLPMLLVDCCLRSLFVTIYMDISVTDRNTELGVNPLLFLSFSPRGL